MSRFLTLGAGLRFPPDRPTPITKHAYGDVLGLGSVARVPSPAFRPARVARSVGQKVNVWVEAQQLLLRPDQPDQLMMCELRR